jgi:uncharacterized protein (TIGR03546 family)
MLIFTKLPTQIIGILEANTSPREVAAGVCLAMFLGFIPWNGTMAALLTVSFFVFRINRMSILLALPLFKFAYIAGLHYLTGKLGAYLLIDANFLAGFWRWAINLPVIAYLDINNTLIAGGLALSAVLSAPVYFVSKKTTIALRSKYSEKIANSKIAKLVSGLKVAHQAASIADLGAASVLKTNTKLYAIKKLRSVFIKPNASQRSSFIKRINIAALALVVAVFFAIQLGVAYFVSPVVSSAIIDAINKTSNAKIYIDTLRVWPLTLSITLKGMEVYDPDNPEKLIAKINDVSMHVSPLALLSRRLVFSHIILNNAEITLEGARGGTFNLQKLGGGAAGEGKKGASLPSMFDMLREKKDWFSKGYEMVKKNFSKKAIEKEKAARAESKKVTTEVTEAPKGELVKFRSARDRYIFEIRELDIRRALFHLKADNGGIIELDRARARIGKLGFDPENGADIGLFEIKGTLKKEGSQIGSLDLFFSHGFDSKGKKGEFDITLKEVDMPAVRFLYEDSLPLAVEKGTATLYSETRIINDEINSRNRLALKDYKFAPKSGSKLAFGFVPMPALCEALNGNDKLSLKFDITGTVEKPQFSGLQESIMKIVKPRLENIGESIKNEGLDAIKIFFKKSDQ